MASSSEEIQEDFDCDLREKYLKDTKIWQQGTCSALVSSVLYNSTLNVEANDAGKTNYIEAAPQELVDMVDLKIPAKKVKTPDARNCVTNSINNAFRYIQEYGLALEKDYPFQGKYGRENIFKENVRLKIGGVVKIAKKVGEHYEYYKMDDDTKEYISVESFKKLLSQMPVATAVEITTQFVLFTGEGIYNGNFSDGVDPKKVEEWYKKLAKYDTPRYHAVPIIGHGIENGVPYVRIQNSWGEEWGNNGCAKISYDQLSLERTSWPTKSALEIGGSPVKKQICLTPTKLFTELFAEKSMKILMVGLDAAGKTTILRKLDLAEVTNTQSRGFDLEIVSYDNLRITSCDVDNQQQSYPLPGQEFENPSGLIFVVDSNDRQRIVDANNILHKMLAENQNALRDTVVLVLANKQDLPSAMHHSVVIEKLDLHSIVKHRWYIQGVSASSGHGLYEALKWLSVYISNKDCREN